MGESVPRSLAVWPAGEGAGRLGPSCGRAGPASKPPPAVCAARHLCSSGDSDSPSFGEGWSLILAPPSSPVAVTESQPALRFHGLRVEKQWGPLWAPAPTPHSWEEVPCYSLFGQARLAVVQGRGGTRTDVTGDQRVGEHSPLCLGRPGLGPPRVLTA